MTEMSGDGARFFAAMADQLPEGVLLVNADRTRVEWANARAEAMLGCEPGGLVGVDIRAIQHPEDAALSDLHAEEDAADGPRDAWTTVRRVRRADGSYRTVEVHVRNVLDEPALGGFLVSLRDASERHHRWESERRLQALLDNAQDAVLVYDADLRITYASPLARELIQPLEDTLPEQLERLLTADTVEAGRSAVRELLSNPGERVEELLRFRSGDGHDWVRVQAVNLLDDPVVGGVIVSGRVVTDEVELESRLRAAAVQDPLTALPNRRRMMEILTHALETSAPSSVAVLFLDLDRFKVVNDSFGHATGDLVLDELGSRLHAAVGEIGVVGRFGGDEYMVVATVQGPAEAVGLAGAMSTVATAPFTVKGLDDTNVEVYLSASIGITLGEQGIDAPTMLHHADAAMYRAKARGRGAWELYDEGMRMASVARLTMEADLARALDDDAFELWYQPIIDVHTGAVGGFEALARWPRGDGMLMPGTFIPVAEDTGGIHRLGGWALSAALRQLGEWRALGVEPRFVSVNLSPRQLSRDGLTDDLRELIRDHAVEPSSLCLEITETLLLEDFDRALKTLADLRSLGVTIALDDFGTGWSSLTYLRRAPIDVVKIDRSFIDGVGDDTADHAIVGTVLDMCRALGKRVVAEGVETESQFRTLRRLGCTQAQGYLFSPPMPADEVVPWLERHPRPLAAAQHLPAGDIGGRGRAR